jgi:hypothetical protein
MPSEASARALRFKENPGMAHLFSSEENFASSTYAGDAFLGRERVVLSDAEALQEGRDGLSTAVAA